MATIKPNFTLRDLFWLVLVVSLALGWRMDRNRIWVRENSLEVREVLTRKRDDSLKRSVESVRGLWHADQDIEAALEDLSNALDEH
jgi:hypothetical protein